MAASDSDLVISISTDLATIRNQLKKFVALVDDAGGKASKSFERAGKSMDSSITGATTRVQRRINDMVGIADQGARQWAGVMANMGAEISRLAAKYDPLIAAQQKYAAALNEISAAETYGAISASKAIDVRLAAMRTYNSQVSAIRNAPLVAKARAQGIVNSATITTNRRADIEAYAKALDAERRAYVPLYGAQQDYLKELKNIKNARAVGAITQKEMIDAIAREKASFASTVVAIRPAKAAVEEITADVEKSTRAFRLNRIGLLELQAAGVNTFQALAAGMSLDRVAMMEGSQVVGAFAQGTEGGLKGLMGSVGATALRALISPLGAITAGFAAAGSAVLAYEGYVHSGIPDADKVLKEHKAFIDEITKAYPQAAAAAKKYEDETKKLPKSIEAAHGQDLVANQKKLFESYKADIDKLLAFTKNPTSALNLGYRPYDVKQFKELADQFKADKISAQELLERVGNIELDPNLSPYAHQFAIQLDAAAKKAADLESHLEGSKAAMAQLIVRGGRPDNGEGVAARKDFFKTADFAADKLSSARNAAALAGLSDYAKGLAKINQEFHSQLESVHSVGKALDLLQQKRDVEVKAYNKQYLNQPSSYSFSVKQAPAKYRQAIFNSAAKSGIDANLLASVLHQESHFRPEIISGAVKSKAGATGIAQFMPSTAARYGIDPTNAVQSIMAAGQYLASLKTQYGSIQAAVAAYNGGTRAGQAVAAGRAAPAKETRDYLASIFNTTSLLDATKQARKYDLAIQGSTKQLGILTGAYGSTFKAQDQATLYQQQYAAELAKSGTVSADAAKRIASFAAGMADLDQKLRIASFMKDMTFQRQQIGRTQGEQQVAADLYSRGIDITSPGAAAAASFDRANQALAEMKATTEDVFTGIADGFRKGESAAQVFSDALNKIVDKIENKVIDSLVSSLFAPTAGGAGSGLFGDLFSGIGHLFGFADGGIAAHGKPLPTFAGGGVSNSAAVFGEAGPEAAVPLPDGRRIPVEIRMPSVRQNIQPAAAPTAHITVNVEGANGDQHVIALVQQGVSQGLSVYDKSLNRSFGTRMTNAQMRQI